MKKVSVIKANHGHMTTKTTSQSTMHKKQFGVPGPDTVVASQAQYIDNLQQQVYFLENEIGYLRTHMAESSKLHPSMMAEAEKMVKKLADKHKEIQGLKVEIKRKQTSIDLLKSEKDRIFRKMEEAEGIHNTQKGACLEEIIELRKERDDYLDRCLDLEKTLKENSQIESNIHEDLDKYHVQVEEMKREMTIDKESIEHFKEITGELNKKLYDTKLMLETKDACDRECAIKELRQNIQDLHDRLQTAAHTTEHERLFRVRLSEDNALLIKRNADLEGELAEAKALLREEQGLRSSIEAVHLKAVFDSAETKSQNVQLKAEIENLTVLLKAEKEHSQQLAFQLVEEQRFKGREEQKLNHAERRLEQKTEKLQSREHENTQLLRDNTFLKDQVLVLQQQLQDRDGEVDTLKQKVREMQVSVEEFVQSSRAANRLEGQRWKQLTQLAQGIQSLSEKVVADQDF